MAVSNALAEKRQEFAAKQKKLADTFEAAGQDLDFTRKTVLELTGATDASDAVAKVKAMNVELDNLGADLQAAELREVKAAIGERETARNLPVRGGMQHAEAPDTKIRSFGDLVVEAKNFDAFHKAGGFREAMSGGVRVSVDIGLKTLFERTAGFAPESVRSGLMVGAVQQPIVVLDLIPERSINQAVDKYMQETTATIGAAEKAEGVAYAESTYVWTERTNPVEKITDSLPVTDEQLEDAPEVASLLNGRLIFGLRKRLETQVMVGDGVAPNLRGFLDAGFGIQTQAKGADPTFDAIFKALTLVRFTGGALPSGIIMHPNDYQDVRLTRTASGEYIMGPPMAAGSTTLFGLPVAVTTVITENTALVGDFQNFCYIGARRGVDVQVGYSGTQFAEGKKLIRADLRACFTVTRPSAFASVTGI